jgi:hypothetical protein
LQVFGLSRYLDFDDIAQDDAPPGWATAAARSA